MRNTSAAASWNPPGIPCSANVAALNPVNLSHLLSRQGNALGMNHSHRFAVRDRCRAPQIIFAQPVKAGHYEALGAEIDYDDGGDTRTLDLDDEVVICAPRGCKLREPSSD